MGMFGVRAKRTAGVAGAAALAATGIMTFGAFGSLTPAQAAAASCPTGEIGSPGTGNEIFTDNNVAVYAGGDLVTGSGAAEIEGLVVVHGDATFQRQPAGAFNVGTVGVGSGVVPGVGETMLAVGGDLRVESGITTFFVGAPVPGFPDGGGDVRVGGAADPTHPDGRYDLNGGEFRSGLGAAALDGYAHFGDAISSASAAYAAEATTGSARSEWGTATFVGTGAAREVFIISAADLGAAGAVAFEKIADDATVIVNVTGDAAVWSPNYFSDDGVRVDGVGGAVNGFGRVATRTMWNFADATRVEIGGSSQVLGSIMVPHAHADAATPTISTTAHLNGRVYTNGTIRMEGSGTEIHNYPFRDGAFVCEVEPETPVDPGADADADADGAGADADAAGTDADAGAAGTDAGADAAGTDADAGAAAAGTDADAGAAGTDADADAGVEVHADAGATADADARGAGADADAATAIRAGSDGGADGAGIEGTVSASGSVDADAAVEGAAVSADAAATADASAGGSATASGASASVAAAATADASAGGSATASGSSASVAAAATADASSSAGSSAAADAAAAATASASASATSVASASSTASTSGATSASSAAGSSAGGTAANGPGADLAVTGGVVSGWPLLLGGAAIFGGIVLVLRTLVRRHEAGAVDAD
ncbi:choice-of-anchor A family protein [Microbacterium resistens]|uniref:Choice-of-anchor A family protein n=1 Tax=Microbacterium resistens TaxID=156977 RepID=A0ABY3RU39_9MICO|nr:choice-of-anchor A family protein [Microbacterium resistens]UGS26431.1 choice-of-anchor A family protein [Microbacterium resistens]